MNTGVSYFPTAEEINNSMIRVYNHMASGILISGATAWLIGSNPAAMALLFHTWLVWVVMFLPLVFVFAMTLGIERFSASTIGVLFYLYSIASGASLAAIFATFTGASIVSAFFVSAVIFMLMSAYGYFTKRSLEGFGQFLMIGLIGVLIASIVNIFLHSSMMQTVISSLVVIIFVGLTAYDTQQIREQIRFGGEDNRKTEIMGALTLYLDFINIFVNLLQLFGARKDD